jgi:hypothetical protein
VDAGGPQYGYTRGSTSSAWVEIGFREQGVAGSNPATPTIVKRRFYLLSRPRRLERDSAPGPFE